MTFDFQIEDVPSAGPNIGLVDWGKLMRLADGLPEGKAVRIENPYTKHRTAVHNACAGFKKDNPEYMATGRTQGKAQYIYVWKKSNQKPPFQ